MQKLNLGVVSTFFFLLFLSSAFAAECPPLTVDEMVSIKKIYDGDTIQLNDNRRVRLLSINTPELAQDNLPAQPLAIEAREAATNFLQGTTTIALNFEQRKKDRYDRVLAHVLDPQRGSLEKYLVELGLAFPIAIPPDVDYGACLQTIADKARQQNRGIWAHDYWQPIPALKSDKFTEGFRRVCGRITKIDRAGPLWIELEGDLVIRINQNDWSYFNNSKFDLINAENWRGKNIELWGWLQDRRDQKNIIDRGFKPWSIQARSPVVLRWIDQCN